MAAVGSIVETPYTGSIKRVDLVWTSSAGGAVSGIPSGAVNGLLLAVIFKPGAGGVQPTDAYDVTLLDVDGFDVLAGLGANLSNATATRIVPLIGDGTTTNQPGPVGQTLELQVANAGNAKSGTVSLFVR